MPYKDPEKARASARASYLRNKESILARRKLIKYDPVKKHGQHLKRRYGITTDDYNKMLESQCDGCKICGRPNGFRNKGNRLFVDHNHITGKVRGLLCNKCNIGVGLIEDIEWVKKVKEYLANTN